MTCHFYSEYLYVSILDIDEYIKILVLVKCIPKAVRRMGAVCPLTVCCSSDNKSDDFNIQIDRIFI